MIVEEGKRLALFIERENMSQIDLSRVIKKDCPTVSRYITGKTKIPLSVVKLLHLKYGLNYTWFFHGIGTLKIKAVDKRNIMTDLTDIQAGIGALMANQEEVRDILNKLVRDFYSSKHNVND